MTHIKLLLYSILLMISEKSIELTELNISRNYLILRLPVHKQLQCVNVFSRQTTAVGVSLHYNSLRYL